MERGPHAVDDRGGAEVTRVSVDPWFAAGFVFVYALCAAYALTH